MSDIKLNNEVNELLAEVNQKISGDVVFDYGTEKSGYVRYDQSYQSWQNGDLIIHVKDVTAPSYTVSHELQHALLDATGYPTISFNVTSGHRDFDEQLMIVTTTLYDTITHLTIYEWQKQHGLLTDEVQDQYLKGIQQTIKPEENGEMDGMMHLRLLTLLDALVFFGMTLIKWWINLNAIAQFLWLVRKMYIRSSLPNQLSHRLLCEELL